MQASSPPRTSLHCWFLRPGPEGWVSPQTLPPGLGPENQPAGRLNATPPPSCARTTVRIPSRSSRRGAKLSLSLALAGERKAKRVNTEFYHQKRLDGVTKRPSSKPFSQEIYDTWGRRQNRLYIVQRRV
jgi:hypothetical protein